MFKMILSAIVALGLGSVAYAEETTPPPADAGATAPANNKEMPADHADHKMGDHHGKMAKKKMKKEKKTTTTTEEHHE